MGCLRSERTPAVRPTRHSAGMTNGTDGHAVTSNSGPQWAASQADLRDHAVRLRNRRWRQCLRRSCDGYDKASSSNQPDHSSPPYDTLVFNPGRKGRFINNSPSLTIQESWMDREEWSVLLLSHFAPPYQSNNHRPSFSLSSRRSAFSALHHDLSKHAFHFLLTRVPYSWRPDELRPDRD